MLTGQEAATALRMNELAEAGPNTIACTDNGARCVPVPDAETLNGLSAGETLYGRSVYAIAERSIDEKEPLFSADELVCDDSGVPLTCSRAGDEPPTIAPGETFFVTYKPYRAEFTADGIQLRVPRSEVPLARADSQG
ncbi:MAG: hypothetical protein M3304_08850 [Actinomycetota bacterium]|nr:hypothetical protein [Actinomycetota bacterium]